MTRFLDSAWLPLLALAVLPVGGFSPGGVDTAIVGMECIFLLMAVRNPLWVLGALLLSEMTIRNYMLPLGGLQVSGRLVITGAALVVFLPFLSQAGSLSSRARSMALAAGAFTLMATGACLISAGPGSALAFLRFAMSGLVALLAVSVLVRGRDDLLRIGRVALVIGAASALAAVLQTFPFGANLTVVPHAGATVPFSNWAGRALGLSENPIYLTGDLALVLLPLTGVLLTRGLSRRAARWAVILAILMAVALYLSYTRSWVMAAAGAALVMGMVLRGGVPKHMVAALLMGGVLFIYLSGHVGDRYLGADESGSAAARPVLWGTAVRLALDHPLFGIGFGQFQEVSVQYAGAPPPTPAHASLEDKVLGRFDPHNDLLNIWVSFGTAALVLYGLVIASIARSFAAAARVLSDPLLRGLAVGGLGCLTAFVISSLFHNLVDSTLTLWILAGLAVVLADAADAQAGPRYEVNR
jgi:O-antigen ligase